MNKTFQFLFTIVFTFILCHLAHAQQYRISIVPVGEVKQGNIDIVKSAIQDFYEVEINVEKPIDVQAEFITKFDTVLDAKAINQYLSESLSNTFEKVIGVTDWCLTIGNRMAMPIRGFAIDIGGNSATISSYKVLTEVKNKESRSFEVMFSKVSNHELGHLFGLEHCSSDEACLMTFGNNFYHAKNQLCQNCIDKMEVDLLKIH